MRKLFLLIVISLVWGQSLLSQSRHFQGSWTKLETTYVFDFDLYLKHDNNNTVEGYFEWKAVKYDTGSLSSEAYAECNVTW